MYNSLFQLEFTRQTKVIAFADDLVILTKGDITTEAEKYMNLELQKNSNWAQSNKLKFNENKSKANLLSRRRKERKKES